MDGAPAARRGFTCTRPLRRPGSPEVVKQIVQPVGARGSLAGSRDTTVAVFLATVATLRPKGRIAALPSFSPKRQFQTVCAATAEVVMSQFAAISETPKKPKNVITRHPNASVALGSGSGVGALVVWLIGLSGTEVPAEMSAVIAGTVAWVVLVVGRRGIKPALEAIWNGSDTEGDPARLEGSTQAG
jgi:hypothetical protein